MKNSKTFFLAWLIVGLFNIPTQSQSVAETPQFYFPLEVGNVWVYHYLSNFITDECGFGCPTERWVVVENSHTEETGACGLIEALESHSRETTEFNLCMKEGKLTRYPATDGGFPFVNSSILSSEVLADLGQQFDTYWPAEIASSAAITQAWKNMTKIDQSEFMVNSFIHYGNDSYGFAYLALDHTYRLNIGFVGYRLWEDANGRFKLRGAVINGAVIGDTTFVYPTSIDRHLDPDRSEGPQLLSNYPNPFNPTTEIGYRISEIGRIRIDVFNQLGQRVATLFDGVQAPGQHTVTFDAAGLPSGMYVVVLETNSGRVIRKMTLVK